MIRSTVRVIDTFPQITAEVDAIARQSTEIAAREAAEVASRVAAERHRTGKMERMDVVGPAETGQGWATGVKSEAWYAMFQNDGTAGSRSRSVKAQTLRRRESESGKARQARFGQNKGIKPLRFFEAGRAAGRKAMKAFVDSRV